MQINITFRRFEATDSLKAYAVEKVERLKKHLHRPEAAEVHVVLSLERHLQHADITLYAEGRVVRGHDACGDMYAAIDLATERLERQLKRHRDKVRHHHDRHLVHHGSKLLEDGHDTGHRHEAVNGHSNGHSHGNGVTARSEEPRVIRSQEHLATFSVEEAVLQLELLDREFFIFTNRSSKDVCVVFRRKDGHFGLVEAETSASKRKGEARAP